MISIEFLKKQLENRYSFLLKFDEKEKKNGYRGLNNLQLLKDKITFDNNVIDCNYTITNNEVTFEVVGDEGAETFNFSLNDSEDKVLKLIKKYARMINCGGLK